MVRQPDDSASPQSHRLLLHKIRMSLWSEPELRWLLTHLGPALTPAVAAEIQHKLRTLTTKGVD
jgi:hypothetical protein